MPGDITKVLPFETDLVFVIGRTQVFGPNDIEALTSVMDAYEIRPLSALLDVEPIKLPEVVWPAWDDPASRGERFIGYVNPLLGFCQPPHPTDVGLMSRFAQIGIGPGHPFDIGTLDDPTRAALKASVDAAREAISAKVEVSRSTETIGTASRFRPCLRRGPSGRSQCTTRPTTGLRDSW